MITVKARDGRNDVYLKPIDGWTNFEDAARELAADIHNASKIHGGRVVLHEPTVEDPDFRVEWEAGPPQWANAFVVSPEASAPGFTSLAEPDGLTIRLQDSD